MSNSLIILLAGSNPPEHEDCLKLKEDRQVERELVEKIHSEHEDKYWRLFTSWAVWTWFWSRRANWERREVRILIIQNIWVDREAGHLSSPWEFTSRNSYADKGGMSLHNQKSKSNWVSVKMCEECLNYSMVDEGVLLLVFFRCYTKERVKGPFWVWGPNENHH